MKSIILFISIFIAFLFIGCGSIFNGSTKAIDISGSPSGAKISSTPPIGDHVVPTTLILKRKHDYVLTFSKEGYKSASVEIRNSVQAGYVILDILTGLIGVLIDGLTGNWNNLLPDNVVVSLEKENFSIVGPATIEIILSSTKEKLNELSINSPTPVYVKVIEK